MNIKDKTLAWTTAKLVVKDILLLFSDIQVSHTLLNISFLVILRLSIEKLLFIVSVYLLFVKIRSALFKESKNRMLKVLNNYRDIDLDYFLLI